MNSNINLKILVIITVIILYILGVILGYSFDYFDSVSYNEINLNNSDSKYIINLDHRKERLKIVGKDLAKYGYSNVERYKAIEGVKIDSQTLKYIVEEKALQSIYDGYRTQHKQLSIGAVGCYLSHINIWELGNDTNEFPYIVIFEDDTLPNIHINDLQERLKELPSDWDVCVFGGIYYTDNKVSEHLCKIGRFYCLHAYMINKKCINYLLANAFPITQQIDSWMSDLSVEGKLNVYGLIDNSWMQNTKTNSTDIQTPMTRASA